MVMAVPVMAGSPSFNGDVEVDFPTGPDFLTFPDPNGQNVFVHLHPSGNTTSSGWDIKDVRVTYNSTTDTLYVGLNSYQTVGDADTDGGEGTMTYGTGIDSLNLGFGESVSVYFDLDQDGNWDVIAGVPEIVDFSGFTVNTALGTTPNLASFGATNLSAAHLGPVYWTPGTAPDLEFQILDFDGLPNQGGELGAFDIGAFMGSLVDDFVEDILFGETEPAVSIVKTTNGMDGPPVSVDDPVTWKYVVTNPGTVPLTNVVVTDDNGTPGNPGDDFNPSPVDISPADGFNDGDLNMDNKLDLIETWLYQAMGTATLGQYTNMGTATGYSDGFPVSATDPSSYRTSQEVGGTAFPVDKLKLLAPWALLLGCAGIVTLFMLRRRRQA